MQAWLKPYRAIYADSSRVNPDLPWHAWLKNEQGAPWPLSRFYSLGALGESLANRKMPGGTLALLDADQSSLGFEQAALKKLAHVETVSKEERRFSRLSEAQGVWLDLPVQPRRRVARQSVD